jgi:Phycobilisome protein
MLKTTQTVKKPSVERLLNLWAQRYTTDLTSLSLEASSSYDELLFAASVKGRNLTAAKFRDNLLDINCQMGWLQTQKLYEYIPNVIDLKEAREVTLLAFLVYKKAFEIYRERSLVCIPQNNYHNHSVFKESSSSWESGTISQVASDLEQVLLGFQEQILKSQNWRTLGFMTTQIKLTNKLILSKLVPVEKALIHPYLKFIEEQVALPWQRVCAASAKYEPGETRFEIVEKMLPMADDISKEVYGILLQYYPSHYSRSGKLNDSVVAHSCLRDLNMFQAYLWLCVLEGSLTTIEEELIPLCTMVMEAVSVKWELTEKWCQVLGQEILNRVNVDQKVFLFRYTQGMQKLFFENRHKLGCNVNG